MSTLELQPQVEAGAAWLDGIRRNWEWDIDLKRLDIASAHNCVMGQLFGEYWPTLEPASRLAFITGSEIDDPYPTLTQLWTQLIADRRANYRFFSFFRRWS